MSVCRGSSCRAEILFAHTGKKAMPVDPQPHPDGNVRLIPSTAGDGRTIYRAEVLGPLEVQLADEPLYMPHHATCPDVDDFR